MKKIFEADLDMDLNVPKFRVFFPDTSFSLDPARSAVNSAVRADPASADLASMGAGVSTDGMRVAEVPVGVDAWVKTFVEKKAQSVITDVAKIRCCLRWASSQSAAQFLPKCAHGLPWA